MSSLYATQHWDTSSLYATQYGDISSLCATQHRDFSSENIIETYVHERIPCESEKRSISSRSYYRIKLRLTRQLTNYCQTT